MGRDDSRGLGFTTRAAGWAACSAWRLDGSSVRLGGRAWRLRPRTGRSAGAVGRLGVGRVSMGGFLDWLRRRVTGGGFGRGVRGEHFGRPKGSPRLTHGSPPYRPPPPARTPAQGRGRGEGKPRRWRVTSRSGAHVASLPSLRTRGMMIAAWQALRTASNQHAAGGRRGSARRTSAALRRCRTGGPGGTQPQALRRLGGSPPCAEVGPAKNPAGFAQGFFCIGAVPLVRGEGAGLFDEAAGRGGPRRGLSRVAASSRGHACLGGTDARGSERSERPARGEVQRGIEAAGRCRKVPSRLWREGTLRRGLSGRGRRVVRVGAMRAGPARLGGQGRAASMPAGCAVARGAGAAQLHVGGPDLHGGGHPRGRSAFAHVAGGLAW